MLKIEGLTKYYGGKIKAVDNLSLHVKKGEIFGFIGPNGAGKSTTIKCLTGVLNFDAGKITVDGYDLKRQAVEAKRKTGYVSDSHIIYDKLTGLEFVEFMCNIYGAPENKTELIRRYADAFGMSDVLGKPIQSYSHGMKQKISVIGAVIHQPSLLVLDEPLTGLDPQSAYQLKEIMKEHCAKGNTVFFSSHVLDVVEKVCDRIGIIDKGRLIACGAVDELRNNADSSLESFFLKITSESGTEGRRTDA